MQWLKVFHKSINNPKDKRIGFLLENNTNAEIRRRIGKILFVVEGHLVQ